jgi:hypothetical protein
VGAPHPHRPELKRSLPGALRRSSTPKSCQVNAQVQVYCQGGRAVDARRRLRHRLTTLFFCLLALCAATVTGRWTTAWDPAQERLQRLAETPLLRALLDDPQPLPPSAALIAVRGRALQIARLAHAQRLTDRDLDAGLAAMRRVWAESTDPEIQDAALAVIVDAAGERWPGNYRGSFLVGLLPSVLQTAREYRVPPSITLAQAILESGWGRSGLARDANNLFGVKAGGSDRKVRFNTREHRRGRLRATRRSFRTYDSVDEAIEHHARILGEDRRYAHAREVWTDWPVFLERIAPRYASSPRYPALITEIVELYDLDRWDGMVAQAVQRDQLIEARADDSGIEDSGAIADASPNDTAHRFSEDGL